MENNFNLYVLINFILLGIRFGQTSARMKPNGINIHMEPGFVGTLKNVTVPEGRDVVLSCSVKNLGAHKVAWIHFDRSAVMTVNNQIITRNPRIGVTSELNRTWNLHIRNVQKSDMGRYLCQINSNRTKNKSSYLSVVVPPNIDDSLSSGDLVKTEGSNVTLECYATGSPKPTVIWKREDGSKISINKAHNISVSQYEGEILKLYKISRLEMGAYMCIAANGVPPAVSKRIHVGVDFPPRMWVPEQKLRLMQGSSADLRCFVEAYPEALPYWKHNGSMVPAGSRLMTSITRGTPTYKMEMRLTIAKIQKSDFGVYKCFARNSRGNTDGTIILSEEIPPTTTTIEPPTTTTTSTPAKIKPKKRRKQRKHRKEKHHRKIEKEPTQSIEEGQSQYIDMNTENSSKFGTWYETSKSGSGGSLSIKWILLFPLIGIVFLINACDKI